MMAKFVVGALLSLMLAGGPAMAAGAPPRSLWGKSIRIGWSEDRVQRVLPDGDYRDRHIERTADVYLSTAGRLFKREAAVDDGNNGQLRGPPRRGSMDRVAGDEAGRIDATFSGDTLLVTTALGQGARRMAVQFTPDFGGCQASVISGRESGAATYTFRSLTSGREIEVKSAHTNPATCSVVDGNVFER